MTRRHNSGSVRGRGRTRHREPPPGRDGGARLPIGPPRERLQPGHLAAPRRADHQPARSADPLHVDRRRRFRRVSDATTAAAPKTTSCCARTAPPISTRSPMSGRKGRCTMAIPSARYAAAAPPNAPSTRQAPWSRAPTSSTTRFELKSSRRIAIDDLINLDSAGIEVEPGDALLFRTGWMDAALVKSADALKISPTVDPDISEWVADHDIAILGADNEAVEEIVDGPMLFARCHARGSLACSSMELLTLEQPPRMR